MLKNRAWKKQMVRAVPSKEMKDYLLQAAEIRCMGPTFESLLASDRTWRMGNLQFARGIVSMLCLQGRILTRPPAAVFGVSATLGIQNPPCYYPGETRAKAPGDTMEVLGQMSYIKWQVINSRWQFKTAVFLLVINSSGAWGGAWSLPLVWQCCVANEKTLQRGLGPVHSGRLRSPWLGNINTDSL